MKGINYYKNRVKKLGRDVKNAQVGVIFAWNEYEENPNELTLEHYRLANEKHNRLEMELSANEDIVKNYDFYLFCAEEEEMQATRTRIHLMYNN